MGEGSKFEFGSVVVLVDRTVVSWVSAHAAHVAGLVAGGELQATGSAKGVS